MVFSPPKNESPAAIRILIVEDEGIIASHIASRLQKTGYEVAGIAESSDEALAMIPELLPELILMDIRIKGQLDGIETTARLRERFDIPVIYLTAHTDQQTIDRAKLTGAFGFLTKPIHHTSLATSIEMVIHKHRADRAVRHQRAWMSTVLGTMGDAMVVIDSEKRIQFLNSPAEELTGWRNDDARDHDISAILPVIESTSGEEMDGLFSPHPDPKRVVEIPRGLIATARSGRSFPIEGEVAASADEGRIVGAVITFRDATSRQAQEAELRHEYKMQAVGRLAAGIAHDFNNLLFVINGYAEEMLRSSALNDPDLKALTEIRKAADNAAAITQQLLRFSRKDPVQYGDVNINDIIRDTEEIVKRMTGVSVKWNFALDPRLGTVRADHGQLKQVLINLAANARDAMPDGGRVTVETSNVDIPRAGSSTREAFIALSVRDTGPGMSSEVAEHLFEPFFTTKGPGKGTGLGLSIVHSIVTDLGGSVHVDSAPGKGATFTIYIPRVAEGEDAAPGVAAGCVAESTGQPTVLLAEDQEPVRFLLRKYLAAAGCNVLEAEDGEAAIRLAARYEGRIDLLITDVMMPGANGFEVARALSERPAIKTIFISGYAQELIDGEESLPSGARFLPKPFVKKDLLKNVNELLRQPKKLTSGLSA